MRKLLLCVIALSSALWAQNLSGVAPATGQLNTSASTCALVMDSTTTGPGGCVSMPLPSSASTASITLAGTFSAGVVFELTANSGSAWVSALTASGPGAGTYTFSVAGYNGVRARASSYSSGPVTVTIAVSVGASGSSSTGLPSGCSAPTGTTGTVNCSLELSAPTIVATSGGAGFFAGNLNGGLSSSLGTGAQVGAVTQNANLYGNSAPSNPCWEQIVAAIDEGCLLSAGLQIPPIDRSLGMTTAAMSAQSTATLTPITGMIWNLLASKNYLGWCEIPVMFAASATIQVGLVGPGTATSYDIDAYGLIGAAAVFGDYNLVGQTTWVSTKTGASGAPGASTQIVHVNFQIQNGTTAGLLTLDTAANGTNTITVGANATCHVMQQN